MTSKRAFTLLEIMIVAGLAALIASGLIYNASLDFVRKARSAEDTLLQQLGGLAMTSMESTDFVNRNLYPYADLPATMTPTNFYYSMDLTYTQTLAADWFAKMATMQGTSFTAAAPTQASQPQLARVLFNSFARGRIVIPCPLNETTQQRFLIISLMAPANQLTFPTYDGTDNWFEAVWNTNWQNQNASLPAYIAGLMSASQQTAWAGNLSALRVYNLSVPKYQFQVSNTSSTNNAYIYYNNSLNLMTVNAGAGVALSNPILYGRVFQVYTGPTPGTAILFYQRWLRKNEDITVQ